jgi:hypothetical protein
MRGNWYKRIKTIHLYLGLATSVLLVGVCIVGIMVRHPHLFNLDPVVSSLNSGVFIFGEKKVDLSFLLDILAVNSLILTFSGIGLWLYPKRMQKKKRKAENITVKRAV